MNDQLKLIPDPPVENPNAWMFNEDGSPKKLLWCDDTVRIAWKRGVELPCPYLEEHRTATGEWLPPRAGGPPGGVCCKSIEGKGDGT